jgi:hypothetical protein
LLLEQGFVDEYRLFSSYILHLGLLSNPQWLALGMPNPLPFFIPDSNSFQQPGDSRLASLDPPFLREKQNHLILVYPGASGDVFE